VKSARRGVGAKAALAFTSAFALLTAGCGPRTIAEAEKKGDVGWLDAEGSGEAVAAMGRLADKDPRAVQLIDARAATDVNAYIAAWTATVRGATWGAATLRTGLGNPARAEVTASVLGRKDPHLVTFIGDLEGALVRLAGSRHNTAIGAVLASAGPEADAAITRRLADSATRGALCRGIGAPDASVSARRVLMKVPQSSRDDESCIEAVLIAANHDDTALDWLASNAEPGLLGAAGSREAFPCPRLATAWAKALVARPPQSQPGLTVPLHSAIARCGRALDPVLAPALTQEPPVYELVIAGLDPFGTETQDLPQTCAALKPVYAAKGSAFTRERSRAAITHGCVFAK
jgi:hypothetical protein